MTDSLQRTPEWFAARVGKVTGSRISDLIAKTKSGWSTSRDNYMYELLTERDRNMPYPNSYTNAAMDWGTQNETEALATYSFYTDNEVQSVGFVDHPTIAMSGASPDGLIRADGLVEIKCPFAPANHYRMIFGEPIKGEYLNQMQWQLACTNRKWCDFVSFDPRVSEEKRICIRRVPRDDDVIKILEKYVRDFLAELDAQVAELDSKYPKKAQAA